MATKSKKELSAKHTQDLLKILKARFDKNLNRHKGIVWNKVQAKLESDPEKLWSLNEMEKSGGEPDIVGIDKKTKAFLFYDCSPESPKGRRNLCYDKKALDERKEFRSSGNYYVVQKPSFFFENSLF